MAVRSEETKARMREGNAAYRAAFKTLIETYKEEWEGILGDERESRGLPRVPSGPKRKLSRLDQLREQLRRAGIDPEL